MRARFHLAAGIDGGHYSLGAEHRQTGEFDDASRIIHEKVHEDANIIVGLVIDESLGDRIKITAIATGTHGRATNPEGSLRVPQALENLIRMADW